MPKAEVMVMMFEFANSGGGGGGGGGLAGGFPGRYNNLRWMYSQ